MTCSDRIASGPGGGAGASGGGWGGRSMSGRMEDRGGGRKDGIELRIQTVRCGRGGFGAVGCGGPHGSSPLIDSVLDGGVGIANRLPRWR
jgi:hypothetical protein